MNGLFIVILLLVIVLAFFVARPTKEGFQLFPSPADMPRTRYFEDRPPYEDVSGPAAATLDQPRTPYHLLAGVLPNAPRDTLSCITSRGCVRVDFERRTDLTGNYRQLTNNYKRGYPDSCSAPFHELVLSFYKPETLSSMVPSLGTTA